MRKRRMENHKKSQMLVLLRVTAKKRAKDGAVVIKSSRKLRERGSLNSMKKLLRSEIGVLPRMSRDTLSNGPEVCSSNSYDPSNLEEWQANPILNCRSSQLQRWSFLQRMR